MPINVALVQTTSGRDIEQNLATCRKLGIQAAQAGARWILFPENAAFLGADRERDVVAETLEGAIVASYCDLARETGAWVTIGGFPELTDSRDNANNYNTQVMIDPDGRVRASYRKIHLFDAQVDATTAYLESDYVQAGAQPVAVDVEIDGEAFKVGLSVCYDLRFPELYRRYQAQGVDVVTVPSAFTLQTGRDHWHALLRARAIENQFWVLAPDQFGHHFGKRWSYGHSVVYDPWGHRVASAPDRECFILAQIDLDYQREIRQRMPVIDHRVLEPER